MNSNLVICQNEVYIEGVNVGQFESFEMNADANTLGKRAELTLPLYAIGVDQSGEARSRIRSVFSDDIIRPSAHVEVFAWYEGFDKVRIFNGWIVHVVEGFPTKLSLMDNAFILRYGSIQKGWNENATLQKIITDCIPIAVEAFTNERESQGFTEPIPELTYSVENRNVQALTTALSFRNWGARSPFDTIQKLMQLLVLYGGVSDDYNVYVGAGVTENDRPLIELDTRYNVFDCNITPVDGRFVDYDVKITGILSNGKQYTATGGYGTSRSRQSRANFDKTFGENFRGFSLLNTPSALQDYADRVLAMLRGFRNKGTLTLLLYPKVEIMDWCNFTHTLFPELSSGYYVLQYRIKCDETGYFQYLTVTDKIFAL